MYETFLLKVTSTKEQHCMIDFSLYQYPFSASILFAIGTSATTDVYYHGNYIRHWTDFTPRSGQHLILMVEFLHTWLYHPLISLQTHRLVYFELWNVKTCVSCRPATVRSLKHFLNNCSWQCPSMVSLSQWCPYFLSSS